MRELVPGATVSCGHLGGEDDDDDNDEISISGKFLKSRWHRNVL